MRPFKCILSLTVINTHAMKKALLLLFLLSHLSVCAVVLTSQPRIPDYSVDLTIG